MASFTRTIPVNAPNTDYEAAAMVSSISTMPPRSAASSNKIPRHHEIAQQLYKALCNAKTFSQLEQAYSDYEEFKRIEGNISGHYGKMKSRNIMDNDFGKRINEKAAEVQEKIDIMVEKLPPEFSRDTEWKEHFRQDSDSSDYLSSDDEGASKVGGRRRRRKSKKRKKKKKKKTRKKRKKRKTSKKRKLRKKKKKKQIESKYMERKRLSYR